jgi:hypothetical protein
MNRHTEHTLTAATTAETITARIGAASLPLGIILFVVATAVFHPSREDPMDNRLSSWSTLTATTGLPFTSCSGSPLYS